MPGESLNPLIYEGLGAHRKGTSERRQTGNLCVGEGLHAHRPADLETGRVENMVAVTGLWYGRLCGTWPSCMKTQPINSIAVTGLLG